MLKIGARPESSFENPIGLLSDCHRRIEHFLGVLSRVAAELQGSPLPPEHRRAMEAAMQYFRNSAPRHTRDEEHSLFPRLRARAGRNARTILERLEALEADHHAADAAHAEVDRLANRWLVQGGLPPAEVERLITLLDELTSLYARHIAIEDSELFPIAAELLKESEIAAIGTEMAARRGIAPTRDDTIFLDRVPHP